MFFRILGLLRIKDYSRSRIQRTLFSASVAKIPWHFDLYLVAKSDLHHYNLISNDAKSIVAQVLILQKLNI